jgi:membrane dipeptidase
LEREEKKVDGDIASLVERASAEEQGNVAQKKLARDRVRAQEYLKRLPPVSVSRIVDHIDHIVKLVGIDHVGIGSDFDGVQAVPAEMKSVADLPNLTKELLRRGYSESDVDKILGGNMPARDGRNDSLIHRFIETLAFCNALLPR